ncbi:hypothetical protein HPB48_020948 [Haemaphysalis longicornis]|uniref:Uncharacterized protein n=1 Tax=Haemaphysalis longicornis TaxID=44386 RepID=A0A9J6GJV9_HAELO|nr:hypothetical protein HPB48_020948 [Haemaphysalis longicornis]
MTPARDTTSICIDLLNISWKELAPSKVANCFWHAGFSRTLVSDPDNNQLNEDWTCSDLHEAVHKITGQEVEGDFETFALADAAAPLVAPTSDVETIDTVVGGPDEDEGSHVKRQLWCRLRECLRLLRNNF